MKSALKKLKDTIIKNQVFITTTILVIAIFGRFWIMKSSNWAIDLNSFFDSRLQVSAAIKILSGRWLGDYDKFILCKNIAYPLFIVALNLLHLSYPDGFCIFVCFTCFLFVRSLKPIIKNSLIQKIIFVLVLYNPVGLSFQAIPFYRNAVQPWATLIIISCLLAIYLRRNEKTIKLVPWALTGMFFSGFFWNLREDSVWLMPFLLVGSIVALIHFIIQNKKVKSSICFGLILLMPFVGIVLWNNIISGINYKYYGIYATNDRTKTYSAKVLGLLIKIDDGENSDSDVWVTTKAIEKAAEASPTFASLNLISFEQWPQIGDYSIWALRDATYYRGYFRDAKSTDDIYKKVYEELKQAFKDGRLQKRKGIQLSNTSGIYTVDKLLQNNSMAFKLFTKHLFYKEYIITEIEPILNANREADFTLYESILGVKLRRTEPEMDKIEADITVKYQNDTVIKSLYHNMFLVNIIVNIYNFTSPILFVFAFIGFILLGIDIFKNKKHDSYKVEIFIFLIGLLLLCYSNSYLVCLWARNFYITNIDDNIYTSYTTAQTLILCCFEIIGVYICVQKILSHNKKDITTK